jgi:N-acetylmuramoyl-L-alanine amidase
MTRQFFSAILLALSCAIWPLLGHASVEVHDVRLWRAPDHTRIVFDLTGPAEHKLIVLSHPNRIVIDVSDAKFVADFADLELKNTPIAKLRFGVREGTGLRLVLEMAKVVTPRSFDLKANDRAGDRLVLDLYDKAGQEKKSGATKSVSQTLKRDIVIAIDAGHGGEDPGASGPGGLREKNVVLSIAKELQVLFKADIGYSPQMIRTGDYYISLKGRRDLARDAQADLFVSIHADAFKRKEARGASVYALSISGATSTAARYLAQRENSADLVGGVSLSDKDDVLAGVLADLSMTSTLDNSLKLGAGVLNKIDGIARLHKTSVEQAGFAVLKSPDIPSILVETGFISNPYEAKNLGSRAYRKKMARAIYTGITEWFEAHPPSGTLIAWQKQRVAQQYTIARGDTLSGIAQRFNISLASLKSKNGLSNSRILVGQKLTIPTS